MQFGYYLVIELPLSPALHTYSNKHPNGTNESPCNLYMSKSPKSKEKQSPSSVPGKSLNTSAKSSASGGASGGASGAVSLNSSSNVPNSPSKPSSGPSSPPSVLKLDSATERVAFFSGNPNVELTRGIIHLFRDKEAKSSSSAVTETAILCIPIVPSYISPAELSRWLGPEHRALVKHMRIVSDGSSTHYMLIIEFSSVAAAAKFRHERHEQPFSTLDTEFCSVLRVASVEFVEADDAKKPLVENAIELPTCPVCLERMDSSSSGIVTVVCGHSAHCECLVQWRGDSARSCPVCRYVPGHESSSRPVCNACGVNYDIWLCLVCGHAGCGRQTRQHALQHYHDTFHVFALEVGTSRVWNYPDDRYVHRLLVNDADGKLVPGGNEGQDAKKMSEAAEEYAVLLTMQLESQRHFYEGKIAALRQRLEELQTKRISARKTDSDKSESKKIAQMQKMLKKREEEARFLEETSACISANQQHLQKALEEAKKRELELVKQLEEQVQLNADLMQHMQAAQDEEIAGGSIVLKEKERRRSGTARKR